jgi:glycosyltransferase involved in cell wall biosynthesis
MKIGIIGTRGIPNHYGGFEQFAEYLATYLANEKCEVYVYNSSNHPYQEKTFKGVHIVHCNDPEKKMGTIGQFVYDMNCILDTRKRDLDIILQLGYTSSSIWSFLFPKRPLIITNMDGLEWKRSKYTFFVRKFLKYAERLAIKHSDYLISDSEGIKKYIDDKYKKDSKFIAYGSNVVSTIAETILEKFNLKKLKFNMLIARIEPENNIETILDGVVLSKIKIPFLVIGDYKKNNFGKRIKEKYEDYKHIIFLGSIYNREELNCLRHCCNLYFHGHSVGGTNPSLLEAMGSGSLIIAHNNIFNKAVLKEDGFYFYTPEDVSFYLKNKNKENESLKVENNKLKIKDEYDINKINNTYFTYFHECLSKN